MMVVLNSRMELSNRETMPHASHLSGIKFASRPAFSTRGEVRDEHPGSGAVWLESDHSTTVVENERR